MRLRRTRSTLVVMTLLVAGAGGLIAEAPVAAAATYDPATPPYVLDGNDVDTLTVYDATTGAQVTSGSATVPLRSYYFVSSRDWNPDHTRAGLFGYLAEDGKPQAAWSSTGLNSPTSYPVTTAPSPVSEQGTRPVARGDSALTFTSLANKYPNGAPPDSAFFQLYQLRIKTTFPAPNPSQTWASGDFVIDVAAGTWRQVRPAATPAVPTSVDLEVSPTSPVPSGTSTTLTAAITPAGVAGSVQFVDGSTPLGGPVAVSGGVATTSTVLPVGSHTLTAELTPADLTSFRSSTSNSVSYAVSAMATPPSKPVLRRVKPGDGSLTAEIALGSNGGSALSALSLTATPETGPPVSVTVQNDGSLVLTPEKTVLVTIGGLANGVPYSVTATATNSIGTSDPSDPLTGTPTPPTPPGVPTAVAATAGDGKAEVSWTAPEADGGSPVIGYVLTATPSAGTPVTTEVGPVLTGTVTGLANGSSYTVTVSARNAVGTGAPSAGAPVTPRQQTVPGAPTGLTASPDDSGAVVSWTAPLDTGGADLTAYAVRVLQGEVEVARKSVPGTLTLIPGLTNGTTYTVVVRAQNAVGEGPASTSTTVTPAGLPSAPTAVSAVAGVGSAVVTWSAPERNGGRPVAGYRVTATPLTVGSDVASTVDAVTTANLTGLQAGIRYGVSVVAVNAVGAGPVSTSTQVVPYGLPGTPARPTVSPGPGSLTVTFAAPASNGADITDYTVVVSPGGTTLAASTSPLVVSGLTNGTAYTVTVAATNAAGTGAASAASAAATPAVPPAPAATRTTVVTPVEVLAGRRFTLNASTGGITGAGTALLRTVVSGRPVVETSHPTTDGRLRLVLLAERSATYSVVYAGDATHSPSSGSARTRVKAVVALGTVRAAGRVVTVTGRVLPALRRSVALVDVSRRGHVLQRVRTDALGRFSFRVRLPAGVTRLQVKAAGSSTDLASVSAIRQLRLA